MKITYKQIWDLGPCYTLAKLQTLLPDPNGTEITLERLLTLPKSDARWLVSRLLTKPNRILWANESAKIAKDYAADAAACAAWAAGAAAGAADAAADAAACAAWAAGAAADAAAACAEHKRAMTHVLELLNQQ